MATIASEDAPFNGFDTRRDAIGLDHQKVTISTDLTLRGMHFYKYIEGVLHTSCVLAS